MASKNVLAVVRAHAEGIVLNPTDFTAAFPYGGTELGTLRTIEFRPGVQSREIAAEEWGGATSEVVYAGERAVLVAVLRDYDVDAVTNVFPVSSSSNGHAVIAPVVNSGNMPGYALSGKAAGILVCPKESTEHPALWMPNAHPIVVPDFAARYSFDSELGLGLSWVAVPDGSGRPYELGVLSELTL